MTETAASGERAGDAAALPFEAARRGPRRWVLWSIASAGVVVGGAAVVAAVTSRGLIRPALQAVLINWIIVAYVTGGILAWWRRPASRLGPLMIGAGLVSAAAALQWSNGPWLFSVGHLLDMLPAAVYLHIFLAFPTGRLPTLLDRWVVAACYASAIGFQIVKIALGISPDDVLRLTTSPALASRVEEIQLTVIAVLMLLGVAILAVRRRTGGLASRRPAALTVDAFALALVMLAVLYAAGTRQWPAFEIIRHVTFVTLGLAPAAFLVGVLDARLARADVGTLLTDLRARPRTPLQDLLARTLRDPSLRLVYWLPQYAGWADDQGQPVALPGAGDDRLPHVIHRQGRPLAALILDRSLEDEHELVAAVSTAAGIALENARMEAELRARLTELRDSRLRLLEASRAERIRLERELHGGAQRRLTAVHAELERLHTEVTEPDVRADVARAVSQVVASVDELRAVAQGIYPAVLTDSGLPVALESLTMRSPVPAVLTVDVAQPPPEAAAVAAYYVVSESLANIGKHAHAGSVSVRATSRSGDLLVEVADDGVGGAELAAGTGLRGLADRVEALGGRLTVRSPRGGGTHLTARIPLRRPRPPVPGPMPGPTSGVGPRPAG